MKTDNVLNAIEALDLEPIKTKLMHVASGEGWSRAKVDALDVEYRRFLYLMHAFPQEETAPTVDVDTFWHYHILDTMKYAADCQAVFGYFMHHYPYVGLDTAEEAGMEARGGERMRELYEQTFGESYIRAEAYGPALAAGADVQQAGSQAAYCMYRPDAQAVAACDVQQAGSQAAYCMYRPDAQALQGTDVQQAGSQAAYCMYRPDAQALQAGDVQQAGSQAAYCMYRPDAQQSGARADVQQAGAKAAYCMYRPDAAAASRDVQQAGAKAAYCMYRPDAQQAGDSAPACTQRDVQEAGAKAAYCMYRPDVKAATQAAAADAARAATPARALEETRVDAAGRVDAGENARGVASHEDDAVRAIMVGAMLADGVTPGYQVLAAGTCKADIPRAAARQPVRPASNAPAITFADGFTPAAAMLRSAPIRPASALLAA
jgi:hypothetical protein